MPIRAAHAEWHGTLSEGQGTIRFGDGAFEGKYSAPSRFEDGPGTNPEELLGAAHAACFSMALSAGLGRAGHPPTSISTQAQVQLEKLEAGWTVTRIDLETQGVVPGLDAEGFLKAAEQAKQNCPISRALGEVEISLSARLQSE